MRNNFLVAGRGILAILAVRLAHILALGGILGGVLAGTVRGSLRILGCLLLCACFAAVVAAINFFHNKVSFLLMIVCCCQPRHIIENFVNGNSMFCL